MQAQQPTQQRVLKSQRAASDAEVEVILGDPEAKDYKDLRDRAAYVYATGAFPTHLRRLMTSLLVKMTRYSREPVSLDRRIGSMQLVDDTVNVLGLNRHPMIHKVREFVDRGYKIHLAPSDRSRRPYSKVYLLHPVTRDRVIVQADGSVLEGWD